MLLEFDRIYDKLSMDEQRSVLQSLISEIQLYKKEEIKESKTYIKKIKFAFHYQQERYGSLRQGSLAGRCCRA